MWSKPAEAKPSPPASGSPAPTPSPSQISQRLSPPAVPLVQSSSAPANASTITSGLKINGELSGASDLYVDGEVHGKIRLATGHVIVGPNGRVEADIEAREVTVEGTLRGNLKVGERAHLGSASRVQGNVQSPRIAIDEGARLRGKVEMIRANESRGEAVPERTVESKILQPVSPHAKGE